MADIVFQSATELSAQLRRRELSPVAVIRAFLDRIEAANPKVNAFITVTADQALQQAREAEKEIAAGRYRGPLHGLPYAPKDLIATKGIRTTNGSKVTADWVPSFESTVTTRLHRAGAILLGKLNLLEFAMGSGQRGAFGPARNPFDLAYTPSGSSSGSGAAVAAGMVPLALGSDTGGSIRSPAKSCGIAGLKPTYGRISRYGVTTLSWTCDHVGPMARTVADVALMLGALAGPDPKDRTAAAEPVPGYTAALAHGVQGLRVGVPGRNFFDAVGAEAQSAVRAAIEELRRLGAVTIDVDVRHAALGAAALAVILSSEAAACHEKRLRAHGDLFEPLVRERLESARCYSAVDYIKAMRVRTLLQEEMRRVFAQCDVMVTPAGNAAVRLNEEILDTDAPPGAAVVARQETWSLGNITGIPALVLPCGFTTGPPRLPLAMQFYGRPFEEAALLRLGHAYQMATTWHSRRPPLAV